MLKNSVKFFKLLLFVIWLSKKLLNFSLIACNSFICNFNKGISSSSSSTSFLSLNEYQTLKKTAKEVPIKEVQKAVFKPCNNKGTLFSISFELKSASPIQIPANVPITPNIGNKFI